MAHIINGEVCGYVDPNYHIGLEEALAHAAENLSSARAHRGDDGQPTADERLFFYLLQLYVERNYPDTSSIPFCPFRPHVADVSTLISDIDALNATLKDPKRFGGMTKCRREHEDLAQYLAELCDNWMERAPIKAASAIV